MELSYRSSGQGGGAAGLNVPEGIASNQVSILEAIEQLLTDRVKSISSAEKKSDLALSAVFQRTVSHLPQLVR